MEINKNVLIKTMKKFLEHNLVENYLVNPRFEDNRLSLSYGTVGKVIYIVIDIDFEGYNIIQVEVWYGGNTNKYYNQSITFKRIIPSNDDIANIVANLEDIYSYMDKLDVIFDELRSENDSKDSNRE